MKKYEKFPSRFSPKSDSFDNTSIRSVGLRFLLFFIPFCYQLWDFFQGGSPLMNSVFPDHSGRGLTSGYAIVLLTGIGSVLLFFDLVKMIRAKSEKKQESKSE